MSRIFIFQEQLTFYKVNNDSTSGQYTFQGYTSKGKRVLKCQKDIISYTNLNLVFLNVLKVFLYPSVRHVYLCWQHCLISKPLSLSTVTIDELQYPCFTFAVPRLFSIIVAFLWMVLIKPWRSFLLIRASEFSAGLCLGK